MDESGKIIEQGNFAELNVPGRYVHSLNISSIKASTKGDDDSSLENHDTLSPTDMPVESQDPDSSRRTGDWATYKYYTAALGRWKLLLFLAFVTVNEAANGVQSMP